MKVAFLIGSLNRGGAETLLLDILQHNSQLPFDVILIHRKGGDYLPNFEATGCPIYNVFLRKGYFFRYLLNLRKLLTQQHVDIIHAHFGLSAILGRLAMLGTGIKIITTYHGFSGYASSLHLKNKIEYVASFICSNRLCFVSDFQKRGYEHNFRYWMRGKSVVLYNGINMCKFYSNSSLSSSNALSTIDDNAIKLCMVGNFTSVRSQMVICKALALLNNKIHFYFIGKRANKEEWRYDECVRFCEENNLTNVHFLGGRNDIPDLLHQIDGFVYSTANDTFGIAVVEAMAAGIPVVVNDHPVMREVTNNGGWATLFKSDDIAACANAIEDLLLHLAERKATAKNTAKQVREEYSIEKHIERLDHIYKLVVDL